MKISRRTLLASGAATALFPWLGHAAASVPRRKLILFFTPHGTIWPNWRPTGGQGANFTLSPILEPLKDHRARLAILEGIRLPFGTSYYIPHTYTMPALWSGSPINTAANLFCRTDHDQCFGWGTGTTVDQAIAARLPAADSPFRTFELGTYCGGGHPANRMIYSAPGVVKSPVDDPTTAYNTLFGTPSTDLTAATRRLEKRRNVLDVVRADLNSHKASLSAADRARLDAHASAIDEIKRRLEQQTLACARPAAPAGVNSETAMDRQSDLAASALGCGLTRILSLQMRIADNDNSLYPWIGVDSGGHHTLSHDSSADSQAKQTAIYTWYARRFAYLLDRLAATPDPGGGSVMDHSLVIWASELGVGWTHDANNVPFVVAGGSGFKGNQYRIVSNTTQHRLLVTAFHWMGFTDVQTFGSLDQGSGPLSGLLA